MGCLLIIINTMVVLFGDLFVVLFGDFFGDLFVDFISAT